MDLSWWWTAPHIRATAVPMASAGRRLIARAATPKMPPMPMRNFFVALSIAAATLPACAQPGGKVIHLVVPFAAGGAREVLARSFYSELSQVLGQSVIVENRPGAGGAIGTASV